jgi:excinuclease UvrABC ATPase subunit
MFKVEVHPSEQNPRRETVKITYNGKPIEGVLDATIRLSTEHFAQMDMTVLVDVADIDILGQEVKVLPIKIENDK